MPESTDAPSGPATSDPQSPPSEDGPTPGRPGPDPESRGSRREAAAVGDALGRFMKVALSRGREGMVKATEEGRVRLEQRQLRKDLDVMYRKLGREVMRLVESGDIDHPGVVRGVQRILDVESRIAGRVDIEPGEPGSSEEASSSSS